MTALIAVLLVLLIVLAAAIVFGGPSTPAPLPWINNPFLAVDYSDLPPLQHFPGDDGVSLAYRQYAPGSAHPRGSVVLIHGSSASSASMHVLAKGYAHEGFAVYVLDMRGHGESGTKGTIAYVGQLEDDIDAFVRAVAPVQPATLAGFSAGGGFVLRYAASARQIQFQSYLLLAPFLGDRAPNARPGTGGWASLGFPRLMVVFFLNSLGIRVFNDLPVIRFALNEQARSVLTPQYSFSLMANFQPHLDFAADIRAANRPCAAVAGGDDELLYSDKLKQTFHDLSRDWPVTLIPGVTHITLILDPAAIKAALSAVVDLQSKTAG